MPVSSNSSTLSVWLIETILFLIPVSADKKKELVRGKFHQYDIDDNLIISTTEIQLFWNEIYSFIRCLNFQSHIFQEMNSDKNAVINLTEWEQFFDGKSCEYISQ